MRRLALMVFAVMGGLVALQACRPEQLDLGVNAPPETPEAAPPPIIDAGDEESSPPVTSLEDTLRARCKEPRGQSESYRSAKELSEKIATRWYLCTPLSSSPLYNDGIVITPAHDWHRLAWADQTHNELVEATEPEGQGTLTCLAFLDLDAGGGSSAAKPISCDDPQTHQPIHVDLEPGGTGQKHRLELVLEKNPRRAFAKEVGATSEAAELVPIYE